MISQALIIENNQVLMVKQYVQRGDIVWNFPGGGIELDETPEQACVREVLEETGFHVQVSKLIFQNGSKYTHLATITGGSLNLDKSLDGNEDLVEVSWVSLDDIEKFDDYTTPILDVYKKASI